MRAGFEPGFVPRSAARGDWTDPGSSGTVRTDMAARYSSAFHTMAASMAGQRIVRSQVVTGAATNLPRGGG